MNRKIYYRDNYISFQEGQSQAAPDQAFIAFEKVENADACKEMLRLLMREEKTAIRLPAGEFERTFGLLKNELKYIEAAGGFIERNGEYLCIHRLGRWDLPKGKLEKKETTEDAAVRECEEECAVKDLRIVKPLASTFHIYPYKGSYAIKQSYWYYMQTDYSKKLKAQKEEDIDEVRWFSRKELEEKVLPDTYYTVRDVITEALAMSK